MEDVHWNDQLGIPVRQIKPDFGIFVGKEGRELSFEREGLRSILTATEEQNVVLFESLSPQQREQLRTMPKYFDWEDIPERSNYSCTPHSDDIGRRGAVSMLWAQGRLPGVTTGFSSVEIGGKALLKRADLLDPDMEPSRKAELQRYIRLLRSDLLHIHDDPEALASTLEGCHFLREQVLPGKGHPFVQAVHSDLARKAVWANWAKVELALVSGSALHFGGKGRPSRGNIQVCDVLPTF